MMDLFKLSETIPKLQEFADRIVAIVEAMQKDLREIKAQNEVIIKHLKGDQNE